MVKICPKCGTENSDDVFWCSNCDYKLLSKLEIEQDEPQDEQQQENKDSEFTFDDNDSLYKPEKIRNNFSVFKTPLLLM